LQNIDFMKNIEDLSKVIYAGQYEKENVPKTLAIEEGVEEIAENAFRGFADIEKVVLPSSLRRISAAAFAGCSSLREIAIPFGLSEIGDEAFSGCSSLMGVRLPDSVVYIGE
jgi:hypothetical protein